MPKDLLLPRRELLRRLSAGTALLALDACATVSTLPAGNRLSGHWAIDVVASDDVGMRVDRAIALARARLRRRRNGGLDDSPPGAGLGAGPAEAAPGGPTDSDGGPDADDQGPDEYGRIGPDFMQLRERLAQALAAPAKLVITASADELRLEADTLPPRDYHLGERFSRIDEYGTATIDSGWKDDAFQLRLRYGNHATLIERYRTDTSGAGLEVLHRLSDPTVGKIEVRSVYRRG